MSTLVFQNSGWFFLESLAHCTVVFLVCFSGTVPYQIRIRDVRGPVFVILHHLSLQSRACG